MRRAPARGGVHVCAESETCVLRGFLRRGWSCVSFSPRTSYSFVRRNLGSSLLCFSPRTLEAGFVALLALNPPRLMTGGTGGHRQPGPVREAPAKENWHKSRFPLPAELVKGTSPPSFARLSGMVWTPSTRLALLVSSSNFGLV